VVPASVTTTPEVIDASVFSMTSITTLRGSDACRQRLSKKLTPLLSYLSLKQIQVSCAWLWRIAVYKGQARCLWLPRQQVSFKHRPAASCCQLNAAQKKKEVRCSTMTNKPESTFPVPIALFSRFRWHAIVWGWKVWTLIALISWWLTKIFRWNYVSTAKQSIASWVKPGP